MGNILKQIFAYSIWILLALLSGIGYMRILLGQKKEPSANFLKMFDWIYSYALVHIGLMIGSIIAVLYILVDVLVLKKKLGNSMKATGIRFIVLLVIVMIVGTTHYVLEDIINVI